MATRLATTVDVPELVRLRQVMMDAMPRPSDVAWQPTAAEILRRELEAGSMVAVVVDDPAGGLAACGVGMVAQRLPGPGCADGRYGYIQSMCTDERHRRQGLARQVFTELMRWFETVGVTRVDLHASAMGAPLYRSFGFVGPTEPELRWRRDPRRE